MAKSGAQPSRLLPPLLLLVLVLALVLMVVVLLLVLVALVLVVVLLLEVVRLGLQEGAVKGEKGMVVVLSTGSLAVCFLLDRQLVVVVAP